MDWTLLAVLGVFCVPTLLLAKTCWEAQRRLADLQSLVISWGRPAQIGSEYGVRIPNVPGTIMGTTSDGRTVRVPLSDPEPVFDPEEAFAQ